jgi:hypothetical protein
MRGRVPLSYSLGFESSQWHMVIAEAATSVAASLRCSPLVIMHEVPR